jgi:hypothetical protein
LHLLFRMNFHFRLLSACLQFPVIFPYEHPLYFTFRFCFILHWASFDCASALPFTFCRPAWPTFGTCLFPYFSPTERQLCYDFKLFLFQLSLFLDRLHWITSGQGGQLQARSALSAYCRRNMPNVSASLLEHLETRNIALHCISLCDVRSLTNARVIVRKFQTKTWEVPCTYLTD